MEYSWGRHMVWVHTSVLVERSIGLDCRWGWHEGLVVGSFFHTSVAAAPSAGGG
jgi:hypothetical protein